MFQASYQQVAELLLQLQFSSHDLLRFCEQLAFSVMVGNGDAHLKNFGVLDRLRHEIWFAPMFDVVTIICKYARYPGGRNWRIQRGGYNACSEAILWQATNQVLSNSQELIDFGRRICGVHRPEDVLKRIATAMRITLQDEKTDERVPEALFIAMKQAWLLGMTHGIKHGKVASQVFWAECGPEKSDGNVIPGKTVVFFSNANVVSE